MNAPCDTASLDPQELPDWSEQNQQWLARALSALRARIDAQIADEDPGGAGPDADQAPPPDDGFLSALDRCALLFGLSAFERELLLLSAGVELDGGLRHSVMRAHEQAAQGHLSAQPTFSLALGVLADPHWDALSPEAPLRRWRLVELEGRRTPTLQPLHCDERILHFLTGVAALDEHLSGLVRVEPRPDEPGQPVLARRIARALEPRDDRAPLVALIQDHTDPETLYAAARDGLAAVDGPGLRVLARELPGDPADLAETAIRIDREAALIGGLPVVELDPAIDSPSEQEHRAIALLSRLLSPAILVGVPDPVLLARLSGRRITRINVPAAEIEILEAQAREQVDEDQAERLAEALRPALGQFRLSPGALRGVIEQVSAESAWSRDLPDADQDPGGGLAARLWQACRGASRGGLDALAQRVDSGAGFDDLVLPEPQARMLREIADHLNHRDTVYRDWGLGGRTNRGRGLCVLFAGESGTGKTMAAEAIANEAALDLYRIDLATVVSKYIGETEKNLKRVFDAAETSGAVLLFDEADALFGKRSEVKDSHDRYANIEIAYLLQRVESYRGLAILTTNLRSALDRAFLRRIRFVVQFPFPNEAAREQIWMRELPASAPTADVDLAALARMQLSGGNIRNVALNAAFIAAGAGEPISMDHLRHAAQREAAKLERPLTEAAQRTWS